MEYTMTENDVLTAETITDEQIRWLRDILTREDWTNKNGPRTWRRVAICNSALSGGDSPLPIVQKIRMRARGECAGIINARTREASNG